MGELVYIGLGSNLESPKEQIRNAVNELKRLPDSLYLRDSGIYLSKPLVDENTEPAEQPDYCNAVALIETELGAFELLDYLQQIENRQGRVREQHWGPRTIDLDILLYGQSQIDESDLQIPHPGLCQREFVLYPMQVLNAKLMIPGHGMLRDIIKKCPDNGIKYIGEIR